jgi:hypothetical protein
MKLAVSLATTRPRNPLVPLAAQRKAGAHGKSAKAQRRAAKIALRQHPNED